MASLGVVLDTNVLIAALLALRDRYPISTPAEFWAEHGGP